MTFARNPAWTKHTGSHPPTASGTAPHYSYAWAPCDENGELDGDDDSAVFHSAVSEQAADDELASFPYGGFLRRTAPDGTHEHDWGGGYRATIVDAVAACIGLDDLDDEEEDWEDEEFDEEELQELHENPSAPARWFRVIGSGLNGGPARSAEDAWTSYELAGRRKYGYRACDQGTSRAAHSARLVAGTTRRAVESADISEGSGACGGGMWWLSSGST